MWEAIIDLGVIFITSSALGIMTANIGLCAVDAVLNAWEE